MSLASSITVNAASNLSISGVISGSNNLTKTGAGTVILSGANNYGGTTISAGTLQVGAGGTTGTLGTGAVDNGGNLVFYRTDSSITVANDIGGTGSILVKSSGASGIGCYTFSGTNTFAGTLSVDDARLASNAEAVNFGNPSMIYVLDGGQIYAKGSTQLFPTADAGPDSDP